MDEHAEHWLWVREELSERVRREYAYLQRFYELLWRKALVERVRRGRAVADLRFERIVDRKRGVARFTCLANDSRFRAGDLLRLSRNNPSGHHFEVTWYGEGEDWIGVVFYQRRSLETFLADGPQTASWTLDETYADLQNLYHRAFEDLTRTVLGREQVLPILGGALTPKVDLAAYDKAVRQNAEGPMNDSQQEAAAMALSAHPYALIQGPPGTGKTRTLATVVAELVARGERVLVTALTHRAIHEALNKVCEVLTPDLVAKIGLPVYDPGLVPKDYTRFADCPLAESGGAYVIGATPFTLWTRRLAEVAFDTMIIDESSQVTPPLATMAMLKASRYVFVGDHEQLPPVQAHLPMTGKESSDDHPGASSIFARLRNVTTSTLLTTCYRMNASLCRWSSEQFYSGRLTAAAENAARELSWPMLGAERSAAWRESASSVVLRLGHAGRFTESLEEASLVADLVREWLDSGQDAGDIGVVVPYRRQANRIRRLLSNRRHFPQGGAAQVTVDTVDRFQGSEREAMILSFTASDRAFIEEQAPFLFQPQRLNVAATRARSKRILLVSESLIEAALRRTADGDEAAGLFLSLIEDSTPLHGPSHTQ